MPEVCEVALTTQILKKYLKNKVLTSIEFTSGRWSRNKPKGFDEFTNDLPLKLVNVDSKGKFIWFDFVNPKDDTDHWYMWNTLGLTGMWSFFVPEFERAKFTFKKGRDLYFSDMRNFGTFIFNKSKSDLKKKLKTLGPDFLKTDVDISSIKKYKKPIIEVLMDQKAVGSGLGNYLAVEVLYRAGISPHRGCNTLTKEEINLLEYWIKYLTKLCYEDNHIGYMVNLASEADKIKKKNYHPEITLDDEEFDFQVYRRKTDPYGNKVKAEKIIKGRTTYWVPAVQV